MGQLSLVERDLREEARLVALRHTPPCTLSAKAARVAAFARCNALDLDELRKKVAFESLVALSSLP